MNLLGRVAAILDEAGARYAVVGAAALAARGVARSTRDVDLLALADTCLDAARWAPLAEAGIDVTIARGDAEDPLSGVVRSPPRVSARSIWSSDATAGRRGSSSAPGRSRCRARGFRPLRRATSCC